MLGTIHQSRESDEHGGNRTRPDEPRNRVRPTFPPPRTAPRRQPRRLGVTGQELMAANESPFLINAMPNKMTQATWKNTVILPRR